MWRMVVLLAGDTVRLRLTSYLWWWHSCPSLGPWCHVLAVAEPGACRASRSWAWTRSPPPRPRSGSHSGPWSRGRRLEELLALASSSLAVMATLDCGSYFKMIVAPQTVSLLSCSNSLKITYLQCCLIWAILHFQPGIARQ